MLSSPHSAVTMIAALWCSLRYSSSFICILNVFKLIMSSFVSSLWFVFSPACVCVRISFWVGRIVPYARNISNCCHWCDISDSRYRLFCAMSNAANKANVTVRLLLNYELCSENAKWIKNPATTTSWIANANTHLFSLQIQICTFSPLVNSSHCKSFEIEISFREADDITVPESQLFHSPQTPWDSRESSNDVKTICFWRLDGVEVAQKPQHVKVSNRFSRRESASITSSNILLSYFPYGFDLGAVALQAVYHLNRGIWILFADEIQNLNNYHIEWWRCGNQ